MNIRLLNLLIPIIAGLICFGIFVYKYLQVGELNYTMLAAGLLLEGIGVLSYKQRKNEG